MSLWCTGAVFTGIKNFPEDYYTVVRWSMLFASTFRGINVEDRVIFCTIIIKMKGCSSE